jgi:hypothetical protein
MAKRATKSAAPAAAKKAAKAKGLGPVVAVAKINRTIPPGTVFVPASEQEMADLVALNAVREPTEAELALAEKMAANSAASAPAVDEADDVEEVTEEVEETAEETDEANIG